jgi:hypothetical protein
MITEIREAGGKFKKKPVVIDAFQWKPLGSPAANGYIPHWFIMSEYNQDGNALLIKTLEGTMRADPDDWIIRGVKGEIYPCKPDIFEATYERA